MVEGTKKCFKKFGKIDMRNIIEKSPYVILIIIILAFVFIRLAFIHPTFSDETFYFNAGKYVLDGIVPYRDFFFAHPPLQPYVLAFVFKIFGVNFEIAKFISLLSASLCVLFVYSISKELSIGLNKKSAFLPSFLSSLVFLVTPAFIAFSTMGYGMWETALLVLLSIYILTKHNTSKKSEFFAAIIFALAVFFRYVALLYLPFLILLLHIRKVKFKKFFLLTFASALMIFLLCLSLFGQNYVDQTIYYHIFSKISLEAPMHQKMQYWGMGFFSMFLALLSASVAHIEKDNTLLVLAFTALAADLIILIGLKLMFYHYFIISLPFYSIAVGRAFAVSKDRIVQIIIPVVIALSIVSNIQTIDFYLNPTYASRFYEAAKLVNDGSFENETIFGEPVLTNYISFVTNRKMAGSYLDSYMRHLIFENTTHVVEKIKADEPRFLIEMDNYYTSDQNFKALFDDYSLENTMLGIPNYFIYKR